MMRGILCGLLGGALAALGCGDDASSTISPTGSSGGSAGAGGTGGSSSGGAPSTGGSGGSSAGGSSAGGEGGSGGAAIVCPSAPMPAGEHQFTIEFDGHEREYEVQVPIRYDNSTPVPIVFDLHGYSSDKDQQELVSGMAQKAEDEGFIVVRPNGLGLLKSWNAGDVCCGDAQLEGVDDVGLMKAILDEVTGALCIDPKRVYATGISNGGAMSHRLACEAADVFAAVAPVAYPIDRDPFSQCQPSRPIAVHHAHGYGDLVVPYLGSLTMPATPDSFDYWAETNGCSGEPTITYSKGASECETYESCDGGVETTLCSVNGGHVLYTNLDQVPIADLNWAFLSQFQLP